jgi:urea carboxylase-associated protein 2
MNDASLLHEDRLAGGCHWSLHLRRGTALRLIDVEGGANVGMLFYNPGNLLERYNAPDTLKCQHTFKLTRGHCLYSDMGRIFCSIVHDTVGWHETVCGNSTREIVSRRWGERRYQEYRNDRYLDGYTGFLVELAKYGLGKRDMAANVNFFSRVTVDDSGNLRFAERNSRAGDYVELRFDMDTLVLLHTCPHPLNPAADYPRRPIHYQVHAAQTAGSDDYCRNFRPENARGFHNNTLYHLGLKG